MKILQNTLIPSLLYSLKTIIFITILAGLALILTAAYSPQSIQTNVKKSALILINEGEVPVSAKKSPVPNKTILPRQSC